MSRIEITLADYMTAQWTHFWSPRRIAFLAIGGLLVIVFFPGFWVIAPGAGLALLILLFGLGGALIGGVLGSALILPFAAGRLYRQSERLGWTQETRWDARGLEIEGRRSHGRYEWGDFHKSRESSGTLLLYLTDWSWLMLPKRGFTPEQLAEIRSRAAGGAG